MPSSTETTRPIQAGAPCHNFEGPVCCWQPRHSSVFFHRTALSSIRLSACVRTETQRRIRTSRRDFFVWLTSPLTENWSTGPWSDTSFIEGYGIHSSWCRPPKISPTHASCSRKVSFEQTTGTLHRLRSIGAPKRCRPAAIDGQPLRIRRVYHPPVHAVGMIQFVMWSGQPSGLDRDRADGVQRPRDRQYEPGSVSRDRIRIHWDL